MNGALRDFAARTGRSLLDELKLTGRNMAVALSKGTMTVGNGKDSQMRGQRAVKRDINRVLLDPGNVFQQLEDKRGREVAAAFWTAYKKRDDQEMFKVLAGAGMPMPVMATAPKDFHWKRKQIAVTTPEEKRRYIEQIQKQVGKAKAGWAMAADDCGGHRGIPLWASGRKHPDATGGAIITPGANPSVTIYNRVSYIEQAMVTTSVFETVRIAQEKLLKRVRIILQKEAAATRMAA